jgi:hypothetical protein
MRRVTCGILACLGLFGALTANAQRSAVLYYDGADALLSPLHTYLTELTAAGFNVSTTDDVETFRCMYLSGNYGLVVALASNAARLEYWNTDVPDRLGLITVSIDGEGCYNWATRISLALITQTQPLPTPGTPVAAEREGGEAEPPDPSAPPRIVHYGGWLKKGCLLDFIAAIPGGMKVTWKIEVQTTPPGAKMSIGGDATGDQLRQITRNIIDFYACLIGCVT